MSGGIFELIVILVLILLNGVLAMAEIATVSARKARLQYMAEAGDHQARAALGLAVDPSDLLSATQIGITLVGILAGAFGGATLADELASWLGQFEVLRPYSQALGLGLVVLLITYSR
jgi:putative hemolysin